MPPPPLLRFDRSPRLPLSFVLLLGSAALRVSGLFLPRFEGDTQAGSTMPRLEFNAPVSSSIIVYCRMLISVSPPPPLSSSSRSIFDRLFGFLACLEPQRSSSSKRIPFLRSSWCYSSSSPMPMFSSPLMSRLKSSSITSFLYRLPVVFIFLLELLLCFLLCSSGSNGATKLDLFNDFFLPKILRPTGVGSSESYQFKCVLSRSKLLSSSSKPIAPSTLPAFGYCLNVPPSSYLIRSESLCRWLKDCCRVMDALVRSAVVDLSWDSRYSIVSLKHWLCSPNFFISVSCSAILLFNSKLLVQRALAILLSTRASTLDIFFAFNCNYYLKVSLSDLMKRKFYLASCSSSLRSSLASLKF